MDRFYLMPIVTEPLRGSLLFIPKHWRLIRTLQGADCVYARYGNEPFCLARARNIDSPMHLSIVADAAVETLPADLTQPVGGALTAVRAALEARNFPGSNLVQATHTYRQLVRAVLILCQLLQCIDAGPRIFDSGVTLTTPWGQLPVGIKAALLDMAVQHAFDVTSVTTATTVRQLLKLCYDQWPAGDLYLGEPF